MKRPDRHEFEDAYGRRAVLRTHTNARDAVLITYDFSNKTHDRIDLPPEALDDIIVWLMYHKKYLEEQSG